MGHPRESSPSWGRPTRVAENSEGQRIPQAPGLRCKVLLPVINKLRREREVRFNKEEVGRGQGGWTGD